jgi:hypothetical protein
VLLIPSHDPAFNSKGFIGWADTKMDNKTQSHDIIVTHDLFDDLPIFIDY